MTCFPNCTTNTCTTTRRVESMMARSAPGATGTRNTLPSQTTFRMWKTYPGLFPVQEMTSCSRKKKVGKPRDITTLVRLFVCVNMNIPDASDQTSTHLLPPLQALNVIARLHQTSDVLPTCFRELLVIPDTCRGASLCKAAGARGVRGTFHTSSILATNHKRKNTPRAQAVPLAVCSWTAQNKLLELPHVQVA
ncbi:unnamed protein product, partial [Ectocarpus sp. 12 AP-2014]